MPEILYFDLLAQQVQSRGYRSAALAIENALEAAYYNNPRRRYHTVAWLDAMARHLHAANTLLPHPTNTSGLTRLDTDQQYLMLLAVGASRAAYTPTEDAATAYAEATFRQGVTWARRHYAPLNLSTMEDSRLATLIMALASPAPPSHGLSRLLWQFDRAAYGNDHLYGSFWPALFAEHTGIPLEQAQTSVCVKEEDRDRIVAYAKSRCRWLIDNLSPDRVLLSDETTMHTVLEWLKGAPLILEPHMPLIKMGGQGREVLGGDYMLAGWIKQEWDALDSVSRFQRNLPPRLAIPRMPRADAPFSPHHAFT